LLAVLEVTDEAPQPRAFARMQIGDVQEILADMDEGPEYGEDPSRSEHQREELELTKSLRQRMDMLAARVEAHTVGEELLDPASVSQLREIGARLEEEAREEAEHAERDLSDRSRSAVRVMLVSVGVAIIGLVAMLFLVLHTVVRPLRALERRAVALGHGDFQPGARLRNRDEIGALAQAFDEMAPKP
jgi:HAMP domain-containing protein